MKVPAWFSIGLIFWLLLGLPVLLLGSLWSGGFDPVIDPPPYFQAPYEDRSFAANMAWLCAATLAYLPLILVPALFICVWRKRRNGSRGE